MARALWKGVVIAESDACQIVEGNLYFPPDAVKAEFLLSSETTSFCPWKGLAHYFHLVIDGELNHDAAWFYPDPQPTAENIRDHIAFWRGVEFSD
ncbi:MAG: DUF427 domain-containing protein [Gammaproteobacteria bacterium]|jgi:uncharacterized protein (DUF427 family)